VKEVDFAAKCLTRLMGNKVAKEERGSRSKNKCAIRTVDMAAASSRKAQVLKDQVALVLFTMPNESYLSQQARNYLTLRCDEEMAKPQRHFKVEKIKAGSSGCNVRGKGVRCRSSARRWQSCTPTANKSSNNPYHQRPKHCHKWSRPPRRQK
jgi:hypothetical protein